MRVVVVGATENVGTSVLEALGRDDAVSSILGLARRLPTARYAKTEFVAANVVSDDLVPHFLGADCVIHLAWVIQPSRNEALLWAINVESSSRVLAAVAKARVGSLVVASSIGVYSRRPKKRIDESWPRNGVPSSWYACHKAELERRLDAFEREHPEQRVVRLRPGLIMKRESAEEGAPSLPRPVSAEPPRPAGQAARRAAHPGRDRPARPLARRRRGIPPAATRDVRGAFNVAAEPEIDGWRPTRDGIETHPGAAAGLSDRTGGTTPPLRAGDRAAEIAAGVGREPV